MSEATTPSTNHIIMRYALQLPMLLHRIGLGSVMSLVPFIILTTRGRITGLPRHVVLEWRRHGSRYYLFSVRGTGAQWYKNLLIDPIVTVQNGARPIRAKATTVTDPAEALRALYMFRRHSPVYDYVLSSISSAEKIDFRTLTDVANEFTVVRLEPLPEPPALPGVKPVYRWVLAVFPGAFVVLLWLRRRR